MDLMVAVCCGLTLQHTFVSPSAFSRRAVVSYWRKYVHEVLVNRLGGLSLPRKSVVRLTDRPDMTLDVYPGRKTTIQLSDHCSVMSLQTLEAGFCYWPSFTGMEHCAPHTRAVHMATCLERKVEGREN